MPEISTGCLLSVMFVDIIRASIHDRDSHQEGVKPSRHMVLVSRLAVVPLGVEWDLRLGSAQLQSDVRQMEVL